MSCGSLPVFRTLVVKEIRVQYRISKIQSHDAILDVLAEDGLGKLYNLEIQRSDTIDHARRTRFYGAMIDSEYLQKGKTYAELPDVYLIYISETDLWEANHTVYPVRKHFENTAVPYEDGQRILYVNAAVNDGSPTAKLMQYFKTTDPQDMSQGDLSLRIHYLKCEEGGYAEMCEVSEKISVKESKKVLRVEFNRESSKESNKEQSIQSERCSNMGSQTSRSFWELELQRTD